MKKVVSVVMLVILSAVAASSLLKSGGGLGLLNREPEDVVIEELVKGSGASADAGKVATIHYTTFLKKGMVKIDSSVDRGQPFKFRVGSGQVVRGWDKGVLGMKVGEKRKIVVPSKLAYGERGAGRIVPPNSTLVYETELLDVSDEVPAPAPTEMKKDLPNKASVKKAAKK